MATDIPSVWDLKLGPPEVPTPVSVLRKQAKSLGELTEGTVVGKVETVSVGNQITHQFSLFAPLLNYSYPLFSVTHDGVRLYPVKISTRRAIGMSEYFAADLQYEPFVNELREILNYEKVKEAIVALVAQSRE